MKPWGFFKEAAKRSLLSAWHMSHAVHFLIVLVVGACILVGWKSEEHGLYALPFLALIVLFFCGFFWHAYHIYREEYDKRLELQARLEGRGLVTQRIGEVRNKWQQLSQEEKEMVRQLLIADRMLTEQIQEHLRSGGYQAADLGTFERRTNLIHQEASRGFWSVNPAFVDDLRVLADEWQRS